MLLAALAALAVAVAVWAVVEWRSAPPPPPKVTLPGETPR
jgi:ABC-type transport system involved in cytochrome c biogenesis permease subunit